MLSGRVDRILNKNKESAKEKNRFRATEITLKAIERFDSGGILCVAGCVCVQV